MGKVRYPIGDQDFKSVREGGFVYVDKTGYIEKLLAGSKYYFLARPRRFGKSLFLSTLRYFFEGRKDLFKGLSIDSKEWKWESFPVLYIDLNQSRFVEEGVLDGVLDNLFRKWERDYGVSTIAGELESRFTNIETPEYIYIIELKYDVTPAQALRQIEEKQYARKFTSDPRKLFKIGVSFSSEKRRIS